MSTILEINIWASPNDDTWDDLRSWWQKINDNFSVLNAEKLENSDISQFESSSQLDARDTANRDRSNHTGTQDKSTVWLWNVDNTSDANKPISTAWAAKNASQDDAISLNTAKRSYPVWDETKLAWIQVWAEANETASEIKNKYESNSDTNAFSDSEKSKVWNLPLDQNAVNTSIQNSIDAQTTFETVSKNLKSWWNTLSYTWELLTSIAYTFSWSTITKTLWYSWENLVTITLSWDTPSWIDLTKTLSYTWENLTWITYS